MPMYIAHWSPKMIGDQIAEPWSAPSGRLLFPWHNAYRQASSDDNCSPVAMYESSSTFLDPVGDSTSEPNGAYKEQLSPSLSVGPVRYRVDPESSCRRRGKTCCPIQAFCSNVASCGRSGRLNRAQRSGICTRIAAANHDRIGIGNDRPGIRIIGQIARPARRIARQAVLSTAKSPDVSRLPYADFQRMSGRRICSSKGTS
jgi:hypothetical protein